MSEDVNTDQTVTVSVDLPISNDTPIDDTPSETVVIATDVSNSDALVSLTTRITQVESAITQLSDTVTGVVVMAEEAKNDAAIATEIAATTLEPESQPEPESEPQPTPAETKDTEPPKRTHPWFRSFSEWREHLNRGK